MNGKMTLSDYRDQILNSIVKSWIQWGDDFVLEEDGDFGHGTGKSNIIRKWKEENKLKSYFNCANSPDLSPIENVWQSTKDELRKYPHWDDYTTREIVQKAWDMKVTPHFVNRRIRSMPQRLKDVKNSEEQFAAQETVSSSDSE